MESKLSLECPACPSTLKVSPYSAPASTGGLKDLARGMPLSRSLWMGVLGLAALLPFGELDRWGGLSGRSAVHARDIFPYRVFTVAEETPVTSGPGEAFYATDLLPAGTPLEVYRRDAQGWLAIRPPARSFSWIPARKLHISADERVATVIADDAVAWVGSHVETVSDHRWQVRLDRGERLAILGHRQLVDDKRGTTETWYQVEPPAGEFRWVHAGDISRHAANAIDGVANANARVADEDVDGPSFHRKATANRHDTSVEEGQSVRGPELNPPLANGERAVNDGRGRTARIEPAQYRADPLRTGTSRSEPPVSNWSPRSRPRTAADDRVGMAAGDSSGDGPGFSNAGYRGAGGSGAGGSATGVGTATGSGVGVGLGPLPVAGPAVMSELEDLTLQLNAIAQREPNLWNLGPLRARAESLIASGSNALERGKARLMLEKIEEFEQLQQRHIRAERGLPPETPTAPRAASAATSPNQPAGFDFVSSTAGRVTNSIANSVSNTNRGPTAGASGPVQGSAGLGGAGLGSAGLGGILASAGATGGAASGNAASPRIEPRFDGTGWLLPVHSTKRVAPPYALLDDNGKVLQYVTPAPGLNLHRYERRRVGLYGQQTPARSLNAPHLTAHRLVDLERHARKP